MCHNSSFPFVARSPVVAHWSISRCCWERPQVRFSDSKAGIDVTRGCHRAGPDRRWRRAGGLGPCGRGCAGSVGSGAVAGGGCAVCKSSGHCRQSQELRSLEQRFLRLALSESESRSLEKPEHESSLQAGRVGTGFPCPAPTVGAGTTRQTIRSSPAEVRAEDCHAPRSHPAGPTDGGATTN